MDIEYSKSSKGKITITFDVSGESYVLTPGGEKIEKVTHNKKDITNSGIDVWYDEEFHLENLDAGLNVFLLDECVAIDADGNKTYLTFNVDGRLKKIVTDESDSTIIVKDVTRWGQIACDTMTKILTDCVALIGLTETENHEYQVLELIMLHKDESDYWEYAIANTYM